MSISFETAGNELLLCYSPAMGIDGLSEKLTTEEGLLIKRTFWVTKELLRESEDVEYEYEETLRFCIGQIGDLYTRIDSNVVNTDHHFFFSNDIKLKPGMFVAYRNISILARIDEVIDSDFYIGGDWEANGGIPIECFKELIDKFPKTAELDKYARSRIGNILKEYFPECDQYQEIYRNFIKKRESAFRYNDVTKSPYNIEIELAQFSVALHQLQELLNNDQGISEKLWQEKIQDILQLLYPQYILCAREITFKGIDGYDKRPDFILVSTNGFIDILEIKKADVQILTAQASYRNNYVPVREFAGAIQQIEKYILCLTSNDESRKNVISQLQQKLPVQMDLQIVSPQGILILGRSKDFNKQQKQDFELIKRQYKNIADIMTYDDLVHRIENIIISLKQRI